MSTWQPIETAPKDGSWIALWRPPQPGGSMFLSEPFHFARWSEECQSWMWPDDLFDPFTEWGRHRADEIVEEASWVYESKEFTHWMPLPPPPETAS